MSAERERAACAEYIETLATFFVCHATGPGERTYSVKEIGDMILEWTGSLRRAEWRGDCLMPPRSQPKNVPPQERTEQNND